MSRLNHEDQFNFLISCIRWSNNGRVDFEKVATECEIVTKGAAAKRYERMMKAHSITVNTKGTDDSGEEVSTPRKRRKRAAVDDDEANEDSSPLASKKPKVTKVKSKVEKAGADAEPSADESVQKDGEKDVDDDESPIKADPSITEADFLSGNI